LTNNPSKFEKFEKKNIRDYSDNSPQTKFV